MSLEHARVKISQTPDAPIEGRCYNLLCVCKFVENLQCMPNVMHCGYYKKRLNRDWPVPTRLPECEAKSDWFRPVNVVLGWSEL